MFSDRARRIASARVALMLIALLATRAQAQQPKTSAYQQAIERFAEQIRADVAADNVGGITAGVVLDGKLYWAQGFGWADRDQKIPAKAETIYRIGSISKSFTAVALMQAAQRDQLTLDEPLQKHLPEATGFAAARPGASPPTLRQFASHTTGLIREPALENAAAGPISQWEAKVIASIPVTRFDTVPGARYAYSNIGFGVLGLAVSRAARVPFLKLVEDGIFGPLDMSSSTFIITDRLRPQLAVGYSNRANGVIDPTTATREHDGRGYKVPNGGIYSTVGDLAKYIAALSGAAGDMLLTATSRAELMRVQTPGDPKNGYGLGWSVTTDADGRRVIGHGGSVAGYTAHLVFDPELRAGVILLRNYDRGRTNLGRSATSFLQELTRVRATQ